MDYARAKTMIMEMLRTTEDRQSVQELLYLKAVASLNVDDLITAHYTVSELLEVRKGRILLLQAPKGLRTIRRLTLSLPPSPPPLEDFSAVDPSSGAQGEDQQRDPEEGPHRDRHSGGGGDDRRHPRDEACEEVTRPDRFHLSLRSVSGSLVISCGPSRPALHSCSGGLHLRSGLGGLDPRVGPDLSHVVRSTLDIAHILSTHCHDRAVATQRRPEKKSSKVRGERETVRQIQIQVVRSRAGLGARPCVTYLWTTACSPFVVLYSPPRPPSLS